MGCTFLWGFLSRFIPRPNCSNYFSEIRYVEGQNLDISNSVAEPCARERYTDEFWEEFIWLALSLFNLHRGRFVDFVYLLKNNDCVLLPCLPQDTCSSLPGNKSNAQGERRKMIFVRKGIRAPKENVLIRCSRCESKDGNCSFVCCKCTWGPLWDR